MRCHGEDLGFERVSGEGTIHSFSIMRGSPPPGFESATPYAVLAVELDEQPGLVVMGNLVGVPPEFAQVGRRVRVVFQTLDDSFVLPMFEFIADESGKV